MGEFMQLKEGAKYRVIAEGTQLSRVVPAGHSAFTFEPHRLRTGDVIEYKGQHWGWGSDPGREERFTHEGFTGEFMPANMWGGIRNGLIELIEEKADG